ncbi:ABC transporter permease [Clostridium arbusti]|uniref:ABC transporter permease n=1 Tax=Clostridium arbusti TaxID=1137848 RepID=UPI00028A06BF|nr:ABC transporter permease [Clostridium arbusti]
MMIRLVKRSDISNRKSMQIRIAAIVLALIVVSVFLAILKLNPAMVYTTMIQGAFGSPYNVRQTIINAIPLLISALGVSIAFKMKFWNIGGEGQIMMGAFGAALVALKFPDMSKPILLIIMLISAIVFGGIWAFIPSFFRVNWKTNETITTLMMNYIALKFITYLQYGPWKDKAALGFPKIPNFSDNATLPEVFGIHIGWIIAIIIAILVYIYLNHTKKGYEISVIGESENTAIYSGINIKRTALGALFLSGAICGVAGFIQASAVSHTLSVEITGGAGNTAIIVAWLANLNAIAMIVVSVLFAALLTGASFIQTAFGIPQSAALILQSTILFFVLGSEFFIRFKVKLASKGKKAEEVA